MARAARRPARPGHPEQRSVPPRAAGYQAAPGHVATRSDDQLAQDIEADLQRSTASKVVYLEGTSDVDVFFALLGRRGPQPVVARIQRHLADAGLHRFIQPELGKSLRTPEDTCQFILDRQGDLFGLDPAVHFDDALAAFRALVDRDVDQAPALNGKWLVRHLAPARTGKTPETCRAEWLAHVAACGGLPEVVALWLRSIAGR